MSGLTSQAAFTQNGILHLVRLTKKGANKVRCSRFEVGCGGFSFNIQNNFNCHSQLTTHHSLDCRYDHKLNRSMNKDNSVAANIVIFGGKGDLAWRKLIPALYNLYI